MEQEKQFHGRANILLGVFVICLLFFVLILYDAQIVNGSVYLAQSNTQVTTTQTVETSRGILTDRNGKVLASNREVYTVSFNPALVPASDGGAASQEDIAQAVLRLTELCKSYGVSWDDGLPLSQEAPFTYTLRSASGTQRSRFRNYLMDRGWSDTELTENTTYPLMSSALEADVGLDAGPLTADHLLSLMREDFDIPALFTDSQARMVLGVLYELSLRTLPKPKTVNVPYGFAQDVPVELISQLKDGGFAGVEIGSRSVREYHTDYAAHILGRVGDFDSEEERAALNEPYLTARDAGEDTSAIHYYQQDDKVGKSGVERAFETYLCGLDGKRLITTNREGKITSELYSIEPEPGGTVALTIDIDFQAEVEAALGRAVEAMNEEDGLETRGAAAAVVSIADSDVLALATYPTYSQRTFTEDLAAINANKANPMYNRALGGTYSPGSTMKPCTAVAALEEGLISPQTKINTRGRFTSAYFKDYQPRCWIHRQYGGSHGRINVVKALEVSCNYFFYDMADRMGSTKLNEYAAAFGLGQPTGIELGEETGFLITQDYVQNKGDTWYDHSGDTLQIAIGQLFEVTPLQLANYIATLLRGGTRYGAHLLENVTSYDGSRVLYTHEPEVLSQVEMSESTLAAVKQGMGDLVKSGSVSRQFKECVVTAGAKTGSAQTGESVANGVFVCFAPFDEPEIAVAVAIERGGSGAALASTAVEILNAYFAPSDIGSALIPEGALLS